MRRNMDLVRKILLVLEEFPRNLTLFDSDLGIEGYTSEEVSYHVMLLHEAGLLEAQDLSAFGKLNWKPKHLTWAGHEFIEASRDEDRWENAKKIMKEKGGGITFDVLKNLLFHLMKDAVFGH